MKRVLGICVLVLTFLTLGISGCGSTPAGSTPTSASFLATGPGVAMFLQWTRSDKSLSGSLSIASVESGAIDLQSQNVAFSGVVSGSSVTLTMPQGLGAVTSLSGSLSGSHLRLNVPASDGTLAEDEFVPATTDDYNAAVRGLRQKVTNAQTPSPEVSQASPVGADLSGSYDALVQKANALYDKGDAAFQAQNVNQGAADFQAAAMTYAAAWKKQQTAPAVGIDFATSLFYAGNIDAALKQADLVIKKFPTFQAAYFNLGNYLAHKARIAEQGGDKKTAQTDNEAAATAYTKAVAIDPTSAVGKQAAASLKQLPK